VDVPIVGVVKEEEIIQDADTDPKELRGLAEFQSKYFCGPLFLSDESRSLYHYLGDAPIFSLGSLGRALMSPIQTYADVKEMGERMKSKGVEGNMVGDGLIKGGVLCVAPDGVLKHAFYEDAGKGIPSAEQAKIRAAVESFSTVQSDVTPSGVAVAASGE
jgi:hypothetical protein